MKIDWSDPEQRKAYHRQWYAEHLRQPKSPKESEPTPKPKPPEEQYYDFDPCRPIDPTPEPNMEGETWTSLKEQEQMSEVGSAVWQMSVDEQSRRKRQLISLVPDTMDIGYDQISQIVKQMPSATYHRLHPRQKCSDWYINADQVCLIMRELGWALTDRKVWFRRSRLVSSSRAVDRTIRDLYEYYPIDMAEDIKSAIADSKRRASDG